MGNEITYLMVGFSVEKIEKCNFCDYTYCSPVGTFSVLEMEWDPFHVEREERTAQNDVFPCKCKYIVSAKFLK